MIYSIIAQSCLYASFLLVIIQWVCRCTTTSTHATRFLLTTGIQTYCGMSSLFGQYCFRGSKRFLSSIITRTAQNIIIIWRCDCISIYWSSSFLWTPPLLQKRVVVKSNWIIHNKNRCNSVITKYVFKETTAVQAQAQAVISLIY